ncbi:MAG: hypothetical protein RL065_475 [Bacteroidota bacterium]|jgi:membrane associated rhomboid family serine protease
MGYNRYFTPAVKNILIINCIFFLATSIFRSVYHVELLMYLGDFFPLNHNFKPNQLFTNLFMHANFDHLFFNMVSLVMFGSALENYMGTKKFLIFYFIAGLGGSLLNWAVNFYQYYHIANGAQFFLDNSTPRILESFIEKFNIISNSRFISENISIIDDWVKNSANSSGLSNVKMIISDYKTHLADVDLRFARVSIGASGSIFGLMIAYGFLFPDNMLYMMFFIPIKAKYWAVLGVMIEYYITYANVPGDHINHLAHLGGGLMGLILIYFWNKQNKNNYY